MSRPIQAGEIGRRLTIRDMEEDWAAAGHNAVLFKTHPVTKVVTDIPMVTVSGDVYACRRVTVATDFPVGGDWICQVITYLAGVQQWKSRQFTVSVGFNIS